MREIEDVYQNGIRWHEEAPRSFVSNIDYVIKVAYSRKSIFIHHNNWVLLLHTTQQRGSIVYLNVTVKSAAVDSICGLTVASTVIGEIRSINN